MNREEREEKQYEFFRLRSVERKTFREIEDLIGVSAKTLVVWARDMNLQIMAVWDLEKEVMAKKYGFTDMEKQRILAEVHERFAKELQSRDLSSLSTDKLLNGLIQLQEQLQEPKKFRTGERPMFDPMDGPDVVKIG